MDWTNNHFVDLGIIILATLLYLTERARMFWYALLCTLVVLKSVPWVTLEMIQPTTF